MGGRTEVALDGVPETMLWTLHNRASEAKRPDRLLDDPAAVAIYDAIDYDYERSFGPPDGSHAIRSLVFDERVRPWLAAHPGGEVVELACGLETQFKRCDDGQVRWICVDLPDAMKVREKFLPATTRCRHVTRSVLDFAWMDEVQGDRGVFLSAQGLLMYLPPSDVERLFVAIGDRFRGATLMFDVIPRWFSRKTLAGFNITKHYQAPPMPWGVDRGELEGTLRRWTPQVERLEHIPFKSFRGIAGKVLPLVSRLPGLRNYLPGIVVVQFR
ncbi:MAG: class I SAM-dependent methyltransferase [Myxococcota bacterium]